MMGLLAAVCLLSHFLRPDGAPVGLSGLSYVAGDRYYAVDDRGGRLYDLTIKLNGEGRIEEFVTNGCIRLSGRVDLEGCAWDPLEKRVWVSDEADASIRQFDPATGCETAAAPVPEIYRREAVPNRSLEALAISPDGLRMYAANEDTLRCDGSVATTNRGGVVRIQEFTRTGAGAPWTASRSFRYRTRRIRCARGLSPAVRGLSPAIRGLSPAKVAPISGVSALAVDTDGSLLVLERQLSQKTGFPLPTFKMTVVRLVLTRGLSPAVRGLSPEARGLSPEKKVVFELDTGFANYEGLAPGPVLPDGTRTWLLISDAGGGAEASVLILTL